MASSWMIYLVPCIGVIVLGAVSGLLGVFVLLRKQSLLSDAIAHAAYPGIVLIHLLTQTTNSMVLLSGGVSTSIMGVGVTMILMQFRGMRYDAALGTVLSVFFSIGLFFLSLVQQSESSQQSLLHTFFLGNLVTMLMHELVIICGVALLVGLLLACSGKVILMTTFDRNYAEVVGVYVHGVDLLFTFMLIITILVGLQTVGVLLMSALLIAPAAAARQWSSSLPIIIFLSVFFGSVIAAISCVLVMVYAHMPTGPLLVVCGTIVALFSLLVAPHRGVIWQ